MVRVDPVEKDTAERQQAGDEQQEHGGDQRKFGHGLTVVPS
jgi:hypothetical protein